MSHSLQPHGLQLAMLLCPWNFPGKHTGVGCHTLFRGIFSTQDRTRVSFISCTGRWIFTTSATWEAWDEQSRPRIKLRGYLPRGLEDGAQGSRCPGLRVTTPEFFAGDALWLLLK